MMMKMYHDLVVKTSTSRHVHQ